MIENPITEIDEIKAIEDISRIEVITESDLEKFGVIGMEDAPGLSKEEMQRKLEETSHDLIKPKLNIVIAALRMLANDILGLVIEGGNVLASEKEYWNSKSDFSGSYSDLTDVPEGIVTVAKGSFASGDTISIPAGYSEWTASGEIASLTVTYPEGSYEAWLKFTTAASGTVTVTLPNSNYIGEEPTFGNGETWELSIKDGVIIAAKCE